MAPATNIFSSLNERNKRKISTIKKNALLRNNVNNNTKTIKTNNNVPSNNPIDNRLKIMNNSIHANTITLNHGSLFVGNNDKFKMQNKKLNFDTTNQSDNNSKNNNDSNYYNNNHSNNNNKSKTALNFLNTTNSTNTNTNVQNNSNDFDKFSERKKRLIECELSFHESRVSNELILLNLDLFDGINEGDLCELKTFNNKSMINRKKIYFIAKDFNKDLKRRSINSKVSIQIGQLQNELDLPLRSKVWIKLKDKLIYESDLVEINIKDCYLNRGDMWGISSRLVNTCIFNNQKLIFLNSIRGTVKGIYRNGQKLFSGYIGENTKIIFRSESARLVFLIQITDEMWHFDETGEQLFQKMINSYFPKIFKRWKKIDTHHSITIAFAISMSLSDLSYKNLKPGVKLKNSIDNYRIVVDQIGITHWVDIMETLTNEFVNIRKDLLNVKTDKGYNIIKKNFTPVIKSNFLEMINFATTILTDPFKQVDLRHTTTHVMIISPGSGLYDVDYDLLNLTGRKLLSLEMTMDLICLSRAPLHVVPLFRYLDYEKNLHHCIPKWLSIFFWNDSSKDIVEWHPRCQIYDIQMMGLTENEIYKQAELDFLHPNKNIKSVSQFIDEFSNNVFRHPELSLNARKKKSKKKDKKIVNKFGLKQDSNHLLWNSPSFSQPVIEGSQNIAVTADILNGPISEIQDSPDDVTTVSLYDNDGNESLAVNSLKGLTKKKSVKEFTKKFLDKFTSSNTSKVYSSPKLTSNSDLPNDSRQQFRIEKLSDNAISLNTIGNSSEQNLIIKKNLQMFSSHQNEGSVDSINDSLSFKGSLLTDHSSKLSDARHRSKLMTFSTKKKLDQHTFNETWIEIDNPSIPVTSDLADRLLPVRWKDVWPKYVAKKYSKWRSFSTPAELPVTISEFPSKQDFDDNFFFRNHSVTLNIDQEQYDQTFIDLLRNMIYTRLVAGFQICVGDNVEEVEKSKDKDAPTVSKYIDNKQWNILKLYMMIDSEIHRITCNQSGIIDVQRYLRKNEVDPFNQVPSHTPLVKTRYEHSYREAKIDPVHTQRASLNWNQIDQTLAGYGSLIVDKKWHGFRSKFVLLPAEVPRNTYSLVINGQNETLSPEELRLEGLRRVINSITRARLLTEEEKRNRSFKKEEIQPEVMFYTGSLFDFISEQRDSLEKSVINYRDSLFTKGLKLLSQNIELKTLAYEIQQGPNKLTLVNRKWHWNRHQNCFVGSEMVNWLIANFSDIQTRDEAVEYGQKLMSKGLFVHVLNKHNFLDGHYFYQLTPDYFIDSSNIGKNNSITEALPLVRKASNHSAHESSIPLSLMISKSISHISRDDQTVKSQLNSVVDNGETENPVVIISNSLVIDVDPLKKSYRQETCTVHYDRVHNPDHCFHIRLEWLTATPKLLDELIGNWSRICERYGLRLIEIPWEELCTIPSMNPFHSFVEINLAINPWEDPEFRDEHLFSNMRFYYHIELLKRCGFMLDNRASAILKDDRTEEFEIRYSWGKPEFKYAQYIHYTGAYMAEIRENGALFLAPNNIYISRVLQGNMNTKIKFSQKSAINPQMIMTEFRETCTSYEKLRSLFLEFKEDWLLNRNNPLD